MILEISNNRRAEIKNRMLSILKKYGQPYVPVKIGNIIRKMNNVKLITYSSQIRKHNITYEELIINAETKDSYAVWDGNKRYCIYYNDLDFNILHSNRVRWNLAHELGHIVLRHIVLRHHEFYKYNKLFRNVLNDSTYNYLEEEADYFAQLILVPHIVLFKFRVSTINELKTLCKISSNAAIHRFRAYQKWLSHIDIEDEYDNQLLQYYYNFIYKYHCQTCGATLLQEHGAYCPICGNKNTLKWGDGNMIYKEFETYTSKKLIQCPRCQNEQTNIQGEYCQICGSYLVNRCIGDCNYIGNCSYNMILPTNARYCPISGNKSIFYDQGFLQDWDQELHSPNSDPESNEQLALEPPEDPFFEHPDFDQLAEELP